MLVTDVAGNLHFTRAVTFLITYGRTVWDGLKVCERLRCAHGAQMNMDPDHECTAVTTLEIKRGRRRPGDRITPLEGHTCG